jgi:hypothetical protein
VLVSILKILGIIILCILAFLLLTILLVLFVPVRYNISVEFDKNKDILDVRAVAGWLLFIKFILGYSDKRLSYKLKVFFFNVLNSDKPKAHKQKKAVTKAKPSEAKKTVQEAKISEDEKVSEEKKASEDEKAVPEAKASEEKKTSEYKESVKESKKHSFVFLHPSEIYDIVINKILDVIERISALIKEILNNADKICRLAANEENRQFLLFLLGEIKSVFKAVLPKKHSIYLKLGFADPSLTGEILGAYSVIKHAFNLNFVLEPDFDREVIEAKFNIKGSIRVISLLVVGIRVYCNKTFKKLIRRK